MSEVKKMGHKIKQSLMSSRIDFFYYAFRNVLLVSIPLLVVCGVILSLPHSSAANNSSADYVSINLPSSCTLSTTGNNSHITSMVSGQLKEDIGLTEINTLCNDKDGYIVYAKGITQNSNNEVVLSSPIGPNYDIKTGNIPSTNGNSSWAVKLNKVAGDYAPTIESSYENKYALIPSTWTKVASNDSSSLTQNTLNDISENPKNSICPKGWRLPTISNQSGSGIGFTNEFARLNYLYNNGSISDGSIWFNNPLYFVMSGFVYAANGFGDFGNYGIYYSSTVSNLAHSYRMYVGLNSVVESDGGAWSYRDRGNTVRCVAR